MVDGGFVEYVRVLDYICYKFFENILYEVGLIIELMVVCFYFVFRSWFEVGENVVILGVGLIGMLMI